MFCEMWCAYVVFEAERGCQRAHNFPTTCWCILHQWVACSPPGFGVRSTTRTSKVLVVINVDEAGISASSCVSHTRKGKPLAIIICTRARGEAPPLRGGTYPQCVSPPSLSTGWIASRTAPRCFSPKPRVLVIHREARCCRPQHCSGRELLFARLRASVFPRGLRRIYSLHDTAIVKQAHFLAGTLFVVFGGHGHATIMGTLSKTTET